MIMLGIQLVGFIFGVFMIYATFLNYKQKKFTTREWSVWLFVWIVFLAITMFPVLLNPILTSLSLYRAMDLYISLGFLFIIFVVFYTYTITRDNQRKIQIIISKVAMKTVYIPEESKRKRK